MLKDNVLFKSSFIVSLIFHSVFFFPAAKKPQPPDCTQINYSSDFRLNPQVAEQLQEIKKLEKIADNLTTKNREKQTPLKTNTPAKATAQTPPKPTRLKQNTHHPAREVRTQKVESRTQLSNNQIDLKTRGTRLPDSKVFSDYYELINAHLKASIVPPPIFYNGEVTVSFIVGSDGSLKHLEIIEDASPQNLMLKQTAVEIIKNASPFPPFPEKILKMELTFSVTICFKGTT